MSPDLVFQITNPLALIGWVLLLFAPLIPKWSDRIAGYAIPALLALIYAIMLVTHAGDGEGGFGSLAEVMSLFTVPGLVMAGWLHYLAFDLFIGAWEVRTARREGIAHWMVIPCLALTLFAGPIGLLLFLAIRSIRKRTSPDPAPARGVPK
ncbi:MAG TPA: ABA4-like family protein [Wenzhouxiangellaceae bacterium]|nr:ABA4-like family protein [Wenzhouxiangellaceae bacterium]